MKISYFLQRLSLLAFLFVSYSTYACNFQLKLYDTYGDGWNGGVVSVYVNGTAVLTGKTVTSGYGPLYFTFSANSGDSITTDYTVGSYGSENEYWILDATGAVIASEGVGGTTPGDITTPIIAVCPGNNDLKMASWISPSWGLAPGAALSVSVQVDNIGAQSQSGFDIKYSIDGGATFVTENYASSLASGASLTHVFTTTANMSAGGMFHCVAVVHNTGDLDTSNDTIYEDVYLCTTLNGNYTIGTGTGNDFSTIQLAIDALATCGVSGPVNFDIASGTYNEKLEILPVTGASATNTITFKSATGNATDVIITKDVATLGTNYTIWLNGADFFTFKNLTIEATHHQFATVISLSNNALHNTFYGNTVKSSSTNTNSKAFFDYGGHNNNYNTYRKNKIEGAYYGFYVFGIGSTSLTVGTVIDSNDISHYYNTGIYLNYHDSIQISGNHLYNEGIAAGFGIRMFSIYNGFAILKNTISMDNTNQFTALQLNYGNYASYSTASTLPGMVANNMISMISNQNGNANKIGLSIANCDSVVVANNSVLITNGSWYSKALNQSNTSINTHGCKFINNIFANFDGDYAAYYSNPSYTSTIENNNYYSNNASKFVNWNGNKTNLAALQAASGKDANSISSNPIFFSMYDLHTLANATNNAGVSVAGLTEDFDGDIRSATSPDIGADEYSPFSVDMKVEAWVLPVDTVSINGANPITVKVTNTGSTPRTNVPVKYSINNGASFVTETITSTIQPDSSVIYTFTTLANFPSFGNTHCMALTNDAGDLNALNDTLFVDVFACSPLSGTYTFGHSNSNDFSSLQQLSMVLEHCGVSGPVTVNVDSGLYDGRGEFVAVSGASLTNTITIKGMGLETKFINTKAFEYKREVFLFDGAKFFVIDSLHLRKSVYSEFFTGIRFTHQADSNTVKNCILNVDNAYYGFGIMAAWSSYSTASGGDNADGLVIDNNTIYGGTRGIQISGNNYFDLCTDNHITNNTLYISGISFANQIGGEITGNTLIGKEGIKTLNGKGALMVSNNYIQTVGSGSSSGSGYAIKIGMQNEYGTNSGRAVIANNSIACSLSSMGIYIYGGDRVDVIYNSISMTAAGSTATGVQLEGCDDLVLKNNTISNLSGGRAIYSTMITANLTNDYNNLYTTGVNLVYHNSSNITNLAAWQTASSQAVHSKSVNPYYFTDDDLRTIAINDFGIPITGLALDILDVTRSTTTPDIGAYEYDIPTGVDLGPDTTLCDGTALALTAEVATEYTGFDYYWVNGITGDTLTGSSMTFDVDSTGTYVVHVVHGSGYTLSDTIVVSPSVVVNFTGLLTNYCEDDYPSVLVGNPSGGAFSGTGISGTSFSPILAGTGSHDISYTYTDAGTSCTVTKTNATVVNPNPVLNMSNDTAICVGNTVTVFATDTAVANHTYFWSTSETTHSINVSPASSTAFYATINNGTCATIDSVVVTVNALPTPTFTGLNATYCQNDPASVLVGIPAGGVFSGTGVSGNTYTPSLTGTQLVNYFYTDPSTTCSNTYTGFTLVNSLPNNSIIGLDTSYCVNDTLVSLNFYPAADSVSGAGIIQPNVFDPTLANVGTHAIIFIYTDANSCTNADTTEVTIHGLPTVTLTGLDPTYCLDDANDTLMGLPVGGYYIGLGAYPEIFEPSIVGMGTHDIIYVYPDVFGCVSSDTVSTTVYGLPTVTLPNDTSICANESIVLDAGTFNGYVWNTGETTQTIIIDSTGMISGVSNVSVIVTDQNTCRGTDSIIIYFESLPISLLQDTATICGLDEQIELTAANTSGYNLLWSTGSTGLSTMVDTSDLGGPTGYINVSISSLSGCTTYDSAYVYFRKIPMPFIGADTNVCWNKTIVLDAGAGYTQYTWSTGESSQTISLDSTIFFMGTNEITVEVMNTESCSNSDTIYIEVDVCTGIVKQALTFEKINVFPNPSNGQFNVSITGMQNQEYQLTIYNSAGSKVFENHFENNGNKSQNWTIDLSSEAKGVYFIQLQSEGKIKVERLVIQ